MFQLSHTEGRTLLKLVFLLTFGILKLHPCFSFPPIAIGIGARQQTSSSKMISVVLKISRHRGTPRCIWNWFATHLWISAECTSATFTHLQTVIRRVSISFFQILTFASRRFLSFLIVYTVSTHLKAQVSHIMSFLFIIYKIKFHNIMVTLTPCLFYHFAAGSYN